MKVAIVGATGKTGSSITKALLATTPRFELTALVRPSSLQKQAVLALQEQGVTITPLDLGGPVEDIVKVLKGIDVVISTIFAGSVLAEIPLIDAAKAAGVQRYLPCFFATVTPPKGVLGLRDMKEDVLNHIKKIKLPYTIVDVGWWYQVNLPRLPSGRIDYVALEAGDGIAGDGNVPTCLTDLRDVGVYVEQIISDPRTLNRMVLVYTEVLTRNEVYSLLEKTSGETIPRKYVPEEEIRARLKEVEAALPANPGPDSLEIFQLIRLQYWLSCDVRGDNTPENAQYLGYLLAKDLYPDIQGRSLEAFMREALDGKGKRVYEHLDS